MNKSIGQRPPLSKEVRKQIDDLRDHLNEDALKPFTSHDVLILCVDRAWSLVFSGKTSAVKRKKYHKFPF